MSLGIRRDAGKRMAMQAVQDCSGVTMQASFLFLFMLQEAHPHCNTLILARYDSRGPTRQARQRPGGAQASAAVAAPAARQQRQHILTIYP